MKIFLNYKYKKLKKILITGGSGLIGKFLVEKLYKDYEISVLILKNQIIRNKNF